MRARTVVAFLVTWLVEVEPPRAQERSDEGPVVALTHRGEEGRWLKLDAWLKLASRLKRQEEELTALRDAVAACKSLDRAQEERVKLWQEQAELADKRTAIALKQVEQWRQLWQRERERHESWLRAPSTWYALGSLSAVALAIGVMGVAR